MQIGPITKWEYRRLFLTPGCRWREVVLRLRAELADGLGSWELVEMAELISRLPISAKLYASTCMFNLVVSDTADFRSVNGVLHVCFNSHESQFWFHHIAIDSQQKYVVCAKGSVLRTFEGLACENFMLPP